MTHLSPPPGYLHGSWSDGAPRTENARLDGGLHESQGECHVPQERGNSRGLVLIDHVISLYIKLNKMFIKPKKSLIHLPYLRCALQCLLEPDLYIYLEFVQKRSPQI